jgi:2'-5' RNA ligase
MVRAFVAVGLPDRQREILATYLARCSEAAPGLRWVAPESLHVTIRFLGQLPGGVLERLAPSLREVPVEPIEIGLRDLGSFGRSSQARVVWLGVKPGAEALGRLASAVEGACAAVGLEPEERPYNPHLTLARARERRGSSLPLLPEPPPLPVWTAAGFELYQSRLGRGGAVYSVLERFGRRATRSND